MQAKFPGTCRDCGNRFPAGTDIDWQKGQGASCCNGTPQVAPKASKSPMVVDGAQRMEWVDGKTTQEVVGFQGDSLVYEQKEYSGYSWMCLGCRLVWERQHQAVNCEKRDHVASFEQSYGGTVWDGRGFTPHGLVAGKYLPGTGTTYVRTAIRREKSTDTPPVAPAPVPVEYLPYGGVTDGKDSEWEPVNYPQADPQDEGCCAGCECGNECLPDCPTQAKQDMTSEEMWESIPSVTQPTITTSWN